MANADSDDYELMPSSELDELRREVHSLQKGSLVEGDKARMLVESMDRLSISINRLITILDDAQKDIIDEYQDSKPVEKLNTLLEQNEMIAKALLAISDNITGGTPASNNYAPVSDNSMQSAQQSLRSMPSMPSTSMPSMPSQNAPMNNPRTVFPMPGNMQGNQVNMGTANNMSNMNSFPQMGQNFSMNQQNSPMSVGLPPMAPMDDLPPMDNMPPLDSPMPNVSKKKFLGIM